MYGYRKDWINLTYRNMSEIFFSVIDEYDACNTTRYETNNEAFVQTYIARKRGTNFQKWDWKAMVVRSRHDDKGSGAEFCHDLRLTAERCRLLFKDNSFNPEKG
eukprot:CAMPEP_0196659368 /NCGR_PEP_ID=MMETSP1086-20130531/34557_1 /TAXON_ID=77921 /ORGANISM="Cyanoptyche  gloeocystis , Strain SAG4.97" /LENGTH=103 /DNA_ID=CAMNT_0041993317 /DNA_START=47 /DNA_END=358 /DNA_ORIENTATION=+